MNTNRLQLRSQEHARGIFVLAAAKYEPRVLETLGTTSLATFRRFFPPRKRRALTEQQKQHIARALGAEHELITEAEVAPAKWAMITSRPRQRERHP